MGDSTIVYSQEVPTVVRLNKRERSVIEFRPVALTQVPFPFVQAKQVILVIPTTSDVHLTPNVLTKVNIRITETIDVSEFALFTLDGNALLTLSGEILIYV